MLTEKDLMETREQIQEDLIGLLDCQIINWLLDEVCEVVVTRMNILIEKNKKEN